MWLAMEISGGRGFVVGGVFSIYALNEVIFGFIAGPLADKLNKKWILIITDVLRGALVFSLFIMTELGRVTITHLYVITFLFSLVSPFFHRTEFTIIPCILDKKMIVVRTNYKIYVGFFRQQIMTMKLGNASSDS